jgi:hypothetical protein
MEMPTPPVMYRRFNLAWGPKAELPRLLRALLGRDAAPGEKLAPAEWIGKTLTVTIEHTQRPDGTASVRIASVTRCTAKGLPALVAAPLVYPGAQLTELPEWAQTAIAGALHATIAATTAPAEDYVDEDVPQ